MYQFAGTTCRRIRAEFLRLIRDSTTLAAAQAATLNMAKGRNGASAVGGGGGGSAATLAALTRQLQFQFQAKWLAWGTRAVA